MKSYILPFNDMDGPRGHYAKKQTYRYREKNWWLLDGRGVGVLGEKSEGIKKYKLVVTKYLWRFEAQHRQYSQYV